MKKESFEVLHFFTFLFSLFLFPSAANAAGALPTAAVEVRTDWVGANRNRDNWSMWSDSMNAAYENGVLKLRVRPGKDKAELFPEYAHPGFPVPKKDAAAFVVKSDREVPGGKVRLIFEDVAKGRRYSRAKRLEMLLTAEAPWTRDARIDCKLPATNGYHLCGVAFEANEEAMKTPIAFYGIDQIRSTLLAGALELDAVCPTTFHCIRPDRGETVALVFRNASGADGEWIGKATLTDFFGREVTLPVDLKLSAGCERRLAVPELPGKGVWHVKAELSCEGVWAEYATSFAVLDYQGPTEPYADGVPRIGNNIQFEYCSPFDREVQLNAMVAAGMKIARIDARWAVPSLASRGKFDFSTMDEYVGELRGRGIAIDAITRSNEGWKEGKDELRKRQRELMRRLSRRYAGKIAYWEMGNEQDHHVNGADGYPLDLAIEEMKGYCEGVRAGDPLARPIFGGFAAESSSRQPPQGTRKGFQEGLMTNGIGFVGAHATHMHSPIREYIGKADWVNHWRKDLGVKAPWFCNETALSCTLWGESAVAEAVWQKIAYSLALGAADYCWFTMRATGFMPNDREQGYGLLTTDYHPRASYASFAALTSLIGGFAAQEPIRRGKDRFVLRFDGVRRNKSEIVFIGWDFLADEPVDLSFATDAKEAYAVDLMGNRTRLPVRKGKVAWQLGRRPSALVLRDVGKAEPGKEVFEDLKLKLKRIVPAADRASAQVELKMDDVSQVHDIFDAYPPQQYRCWNWWYDLVTQVKFYRSGSKITVCAEVSDERHELDAKNALEGDSVLFVLGGWQVLASYEGEKRTVQVLKHPKGMDPTGSEKLFDLKVKVTPKMGVHSMPLATYELTFDPASLGFGKTGAIPFNIRVYDNDFGESCDAWMEWSPLDEEPRVFINVSASQVSSAHVGSEIGVSL